MLVLKPWGRGAERSPLAWSLGSDARSPGVQGHSLEGTLEGKGICQELQGG